MSVLLVVTLQLWISTTWAEMCDITDIVPSRGDGGKYFSVDRQDVCYVFALREVPVTTAQDFCRGIGGRLTDVESRTDNSVQKIIADEMRNLTVIDTDYWIGFLWNAQLEAWYWDTGKCLPVCCSQSTCSDLSHRLYISPPSKWCVTDCGGCVYMNYQDVGRLNCKTRKSFICKIDLTCHSQDVNKSSTCTPRCVDYIRQHQSAPDISTTSMTPTAPWSGHATDPGVVTNTTEDDKATSCGAHSQFVEECNAENKLLLILLTIIGALSGILFVVTIVLCTRIAKYRTMLTDKVSITRISMVDILHADTPTTAPRKTPSNPSNSRPGSTSEHLCNNPYNTYSTPDSPGGNATEATGLIYQDNGYSAPSHRLASGDEANAESQAGRKEYALLNRKGEGLHNVQNIYGAESASRPQRDDRKISDTYETYMKQQ